MDEMGPRWLRRVHLSNMGEQFASRKTLSHSDFHYAKHPQESLLLRLMLVPAFLPGLFSHRVGRDSVAAAALDLGQALCLAHLGQTDGTSPQGAPVPVIRCL